MTVRPTREQVLSLAPDAAAATSALQLADPGVWSAAGSDDEAVWGRYIATSAEPYDVAVDLSDDAGGPAYRCNCPSRKLPCKHALGLLLLYAGAGVGRARRLPFAAEWMRRRTVSRTDSGDSEAARRPVPAHDGGETAGDRTLGVGVRRSGSAGAPDPARRKRRIDRAEQMSAGLRDLDRWLIDRIRVGLAAAELSDPATWERVAARLVDAKCGGLANRVKRVAGKVGGKASWYEDVLEEMALLHALAVGAQHSSTLPPGLAEGVDAASGLTVGKEEVLAGVASTAPWMVAGQSRTREDRITVERTWLVTPACGRDDAPTWAMVLSFATVGHDVASEHTVGTAFDADVHWYPGAIALRALVGRRHSEVRPAASTPPSSTVGEALAAYGWALAAEPWLERYPMCLYAAPAPFGKGRWSFADRTGSVAVARSFSRMAEIVSVSGGSAVAVMGEWSPQGFLPLSLFADRAAVAL